MHKFTTQSCLDTPVVAGSHDSNNPICPTWIPVHPMGQTIL